MIPFPSMMAGAAKSPFQPQTIFFQTPGNFQWKVLPYNNNVSVAVWGAGAAGAPSFGSVGASGVASLFNAPSGTLTGLGGIRGGAYDDEGFGGAASGGTTNQTGGNGNIGAIKWSPTNLTGGILDLWFDANNSGSIARTGTNITGWTDLAGGVTATSTSTNPTYNSNLLNGMPGVVLSGGANCGFTANTTRAAFTGSLSIFSVIKMTAVNHWNAVFAGLNAPSPSDPDAIALFAAMTVQPSAQRKTLYNNIIVSLKNKGIWSRLDVFYVLAVETSQQASLNWKNPGVNVLGTTGTPTFTADVGFLGNATSYKTTNWTVVQYTLNDCSAFAWSGTNSRADSNDDLFINQPPGASVTSLNPWRTSTNQIAVALNSPGTGYDIPPTDTLGLFTLTRTIASSLTVYHNTLTLGTAPEVTGSIPGSPMAIGRGSRLIKMVGFGASLTAQNNIDLYNTFNSYLTNLAAPVPPTYAPGEPTVAFTYSASPEHIGILQAVFAASQSTQSLAVNMPAIAEWMSPGISGAGGAITATNFTSGANVSNISAVTTASISPAVNKLVIVSVSGGGGGTVVPTVTGAGGTWVLIANKFDTGGNRVVALFRDLSAHPGSGALTIDFAGQNQSAIGWSVDQFDNVDTTGTHGSGAIVQWVTGATTSGATTGATMNLAALGSANNVAFGYLRNNSTGAISPGAGFTELSDIGNNDAEWAINSTTINWTWASQTVVSVAIVVEIKAGTSSWGAVTPYINGTLGGSIAALPNFGFTQIGIELGFDSSSDGFIGSMHELLVIDGLASTVDRQSIEGYLAWKWGLQSSLPSSHPYFSLPPSAAGGDGKGGASPYGGAQSSGAGNYPGGGGAGAGSALGQGAGAGGYSTKTYTPGQLVIGSNVAFTVGSAGTGTYSGANGEIVITVDQGFGAAPIYIGISYAQSPTTTSLSINIPVGTQNNDLMLAFASCLLNQPTNAPAGWTLINNVIGGAYLSQLFYKIASNEPASYTWPSTSYPVIGIRTYRGANTASPINSSAAVTINALQCSIPALTETAAPNEVYVGFWTNNDPSNNLSAPGDLGDISTHSAPQTLSWVSGDKNVSGVAGQETASLAGITNWWNSIACSIKP